MQLPDMVNLRLTSILVVGEHNFNKNSDLFKDMKIEYTQDNKTLITSKIIYALLEPYFPCIFLGHIREALYNLYTHPNYNQDLESAFLAELDKAINKRLK